MKAEAGIYILKTTEKKKRVNHELSEKSRGMLLDALGNQVNKIDIKLRSLCDNLTLQGTTEFAQRYAVGAITKIIKGQPVTNRTMLDSLFNTYAPAINASLLKSGYNSVAAMKDAAFNGTINPANFLGALDSGLIAIQEEAEMKSRFERYGEEIPIDLVEECDHLYTIEAPERRTEAATKIETLPPLNMVKINLIGHVKNKNAELWDMNDFSYKLADAMAQKKAIVLRVGRTIYENVYLVKYEPKITNIHEIKFNATFYYEYTKGNISYEDKQSGCRIIKNRRSQDLLNYTSKPEFIGQGLVEKVTKKDVTIIAQAKKLLGKDKILIDGEYV